MFLKWAYAFMHEGETSSPYYQEWANNFKKSSNEPTLIDLAARYSNFNESNITGVEDDNIVSNKCLTLKDLDLSPSDVEEAMKKWLWRYKDGGQFAKA